MSGVVFLLWFIIMSQICFVTLSSLQVYYFTSVAQAQRAHSYFSRWVAIIHTFRVTENTYISGNRGYDHTHISKRCKY